LVALPNIGMSLVVGKPSTGVSLVVQPSSGMSLVGSPRSGMALVSLPSSGGMSRGVSDQMIRITYSESNKNEGTPLVGLPSREARLWSLYLMERHVVSRFT
jgi:hypothetical protein